MPRKLPSSTPPPSRAEGEANLLNDQASDPTTVIQFPDPTPYLSDSGNFSQGAKGVQYGRHIQNLGNAPTTGTVKPSRLPGHWSHRYGPLPATNWSCALATLRCSAADSIPGFTYYGSHPGNRQT